MFGPVKSGVGARDQRVNRSSRVIRDGGTDADDSAYRLTADLDSGRLEC
jgi:hypothetical protein